MDEDNHRKNLSYYGVKSSKELDNKQASDYISKLSKAEVNGKLQIKYYGKGKRGLNRHLTPEQAERIGILQTALCWSSEGLTSFMERQTGKKTAVQMLTNHRATKVIVGLEKVLAKGNQEFYIVINKLTNGGLKLILNKKAIK